MREVKLALSPNRKLRDALFGIVCFCRRVSASPSQNRLDYDDKFHCKVPSTNRYFIYESFYIKL